MSSLLTNLLARNRALALLCLAVLLVYPHVSHAQSLPVVSAGGAHTLALAADGSLWAWGDNEYGQLGNGSDSDSLTPVQISGTYTAIAAGGTHSLALTSDGSLWAWGGNYWGQLGDGTGEDRAVPVRISGTYTAIAAGGAHSLALTDSGYLYAWGANYSGQLGDNLSTFYSLSPELVATGYAAVAAGEDHSLGLKTGGTLWGWGGNYSGQVGDGSTEDLAVPVQVGSGFSAIAAGSEHSLALGSDGALWAWGSNYWGQLGDGGTTDRLSPTKVGGTYDAVEAGGSHSLGLSDDGQLYAWGQNYWGQLGDGTGEDQSSPVQVNGAYAAMAAGNRHSLGLTGDGSLWAWGDNGDGQIGDGSGYDRLAPAPVDVELVQAATQEYVYYVPYYPDKNDFMLGFGLSNLNGDEAAEVSVAYFDNAGAELGQDSASIAAGGHASFMRGVEMATNGWARVTASQPIYGMALIFENSGPMFDMDLKAETTTELVAAHVDTSDGWASKAMLANPGQAQANVTLTFTPNDGNNPQTASLSIPALGAVQYDLGQSFPGMAGSLEIASDQGLVGFLLYDGRSDTNAWLGGLSIVPSQGTGAGEQVYYVPYYPNEDEFWLGFGLSNVENAGTTDYTVEYFDNNGVALGQDNGSIAAGGHASFMRDVKELTNGWARITASRSLYGMALVFEPGGPLFDMDIGSETATELVAAHVDTSAGWASRAMLANPNQTQANVTLTFSPNSGSPTETASLSIPAQGAVQYDLSQSFPGMAGSLQISSDQGLAGFLLYDGRNDPNAWLGGLSIVPRQ